MKVTKRYHYTPTRTVKLKRLEIPSVGKDMAFIYPHIYSKEMKTRIYNQDLYDNVNSNFINNVPKLATTLVSVN